MIPRICVVLVVVLLAGCSVTSARPGGGSAAAPSRTPTPTRIAAPASSPSASPKHSTTRHRVTNIYSHATGRIRPALRDIPKRVYVPNNLSNTMTVINARTLRVVRTVPVGASPQHVTPSWDMRRLYVNNTAGNSLSVVNPKTGRITKTIGVTDPYNLYFTPDGKQAIVVAERYRRLDFRDPRRWTLEESVHVPSPGIDHLDFSADGRFLLASTEFSGWVYRVNVIKHRVTGKVHVGGLPVDVKAAPDGNVFYVANQGLNGVSLVDPHRMRRIGFIPTGDGAHGLCVSRDATRLYVSNRRGGSITVVSFAKRAKVATWHVGGSPDMLQVSADGTQLWVSNRFSGTVSVIDTRSGKVVKRIAVGQSPHGLAYFPQPGGYSVGHNGVYR